jgi:RHS repeat-associated protein
MYPLKYGSVVQKQEYDYGPSAPGPLLRQTNTQFQWQNSSSFLTANLLSPLASVAILNGSGTQMAQTTYAYDETGNGSVCTTLPCGDLTSVTRWLNGGTSPKTQYAYNAQGMRTKMIDPLNNQTIYTYDSTGAFLSQVQYPTTGTVAHIENFSYDLNSGLLNWHKDENGQQTSYGYDSMRRIKNVTYPDGGSENFSYNDSVSSPSFTFTKAITPAITFTETGFVDGFGRPKQAKTTVPTSTCSGGYSYVATTYDNEGRKFSVSNPYCTTSDATYGLTKTYYDPLNRVTSVVEQDNSTVTYSYTGSCTTVTDEAGQQRKSCSDGLGRMTSVWEDPGVLNFQTSYTYDPLDNLLSVAQSGSRPRTFIYDSLSRLKSSTNPESNTATNPPTTVPTTYTYDANGNVSTKIEPAPNQTGTATVTLTYCYDALNRLTAKAYTLQTCTNGTLPSPAVTYLYDQSSYNGLTIAYGFGRRTGMTDPAGVETWSYDKVGRPAIDQRTTNGVTKSTTYGYNLDGSIATLNYPSGRLVTYTPNIAAQPVSAVDSAYGINYAVGPTTCPNGQTASGACYTPHGSLASLKNSSNLTTTSYYNTRLQPCRLAVNATGTAPGTCGDATNRGDVLDFTYDFHLGATNNGNVYKVTNNRTNASDRNINYTYDSLNRISQAYTDGNLWGETYSIDTWGNLYGIGPYTGKPAGETLSQGINAANQLTNACVANCYDAAGNLLNDGLNSYTYDAEGHTSIGAGVTYYYDGDGKRVRKSAGTLYWYGVNSDALDETDASGTLTNEYVFFGGKRIARRDSSSNVFYYFADHLGTSRAIVQAGQTTPCYDQDFYPYGREVPHGSEIPAFVNTCPQNYKFTGKERDSESGLDNFGARYNSSQYGRFMTPDRGRFVWGDPQSLNRYAYTRNNPLKYIDPSGNHFVVASDVLPQVRQYISTLLRTESGRQLVMQIALSPRANSFGSGSLPRTQLAGNQVAVTNATTTVIPGNTPGAVVGTATTMDSSNISFTAGATGQTTFQTGLLAFTHEGFHVSDANSASTFQGAVAAGVAGDAPSQPGASDTTGGTAESRAEQVLMGLGSATGNYTPDAAMDQTANQLILYGQVLQNAPAAGSLQLQSAPNTQQLNPPCDQENNPSCG